ncbi:MULTISPECIES: Nif11 domain/cupin domain-containing protein [unclassified Cyanobium]|uniref:Nif11 domain/cupin domain-containing protein n=1 Tax=unclassified Cyanobium TaxID=2627006 RepID=UPI0020CDC8E7|nr:MULTISPECIES: Nif11 domain/cupin domain-containing protein [unclassified Cyanobium]MCP9833031.1 Nif11 domain/cupin domain-containing protein [Cyanobium sp. La Preciosa 7G6]MCP9935781.1 Nif11 domain/cupin domain-containing protein [Cyanobium sp. Aljojuca 7A6]
MAEAQLQQFLEKVRQLNAFVARSEADPALRAALRDCGDHHQVVALARSCGFEIGRRWGEAPSGDRAGASLVQSPCPAAGEEVTTVLLQTPQLRLERIHSCSASSPEGFWYDQTEHEWVLLLQGSAQLQFADEPEARSLACGEALLISAGRRHRLLASDPAPGTIWLALFWTPHPADSLPTH